MTGLLSAFFLGGLAALALRMPAFLVVSVAAIIAWCLYAAFAELTFGHASLAGVAGWIASQAGYFSVVLLRAALVGTDPAPLARPNGAQPNQIRREERPVG